MVNDSVEQVENRHAEEMVTSMVVEAWTRCEVNRLVKDILNSDDKTQLRVEIILMEKKQEEKELLDTLKKEESNLRRLKRIEMLKKSLKNKMVAKKQRSMLQMLRRLSLEELELDIDDKEKLARERMEVVETDDKEEQMEQEDSSTIEDGDNVDVMDMVDKYDGKHLVSIDSVEDRSSQQDETQQQLVRAEYNFTEMRNVDNMSPSIVHDKVERFIDISTMLTFWETQEDEESTPIPERVRERRRRSAKLEQLVSVMGLESKTEVDAKVTPKE